MGRKYLDIIRNAANGSDTASSQLQQTIAGLERYSQDLKALRVHQAQLRGPTRPSKLKKIAHLQKTTHKEWAAKIPNPIPVLNRPVPKEQLPNPDRPRRVPYLAAAHGIPFLRYKSGSQSIELSRVIRSMYAQEFGRWEHIERLKLDADHALLEDNWDGLTGQNKDHEDVNDIQGRSTSWTTPIRESERQLTSVAREATNKRRDTAQRMFEIFKEEKALAMQEREDRRRLAKQNTGSELGEGRKLAAKVRKEQSDLTTVKSAHRYHFRATDRKNR